MGLGSQAEVRIGKAFAVEGSVLDLGSGMGEQIDGVSVILISMRYGR